MRLAQQAEKWLADSISREVRPIKGNTAIAYRSYLDQHIIPDIGDIELAEFATNKAMKAFISGLYAKNLSVSSIAGIAACAKAIIKSAEDDEGNLLFPIQWNNRFCRIPEVDPTRQRRPVPSPGELKAALSAAPSHYTPILALLAGTGLRIAEAAAIKVLGESSDSAWIPERALFVIRKQRTRSHLDEPKTRAGVREIDISDTLNRYLIRALPRSPGDVLLTGKRGGPLNNINYNELNAIGVPGCHSLRRFRVRHLKNKNVPKELIKFWVGHSTNDDISERYTEFGNDIEARRDWVERAGLGFELP